MVSPWIRLHFYVLPHFLTQVVWIELDSQGKDKSTGWGSWPGDMPKMTQAALWRSNMRIQGFYSRLHGPSPSHRSPELWLNPSRAPDPAQVLHVGCSLPHGLWVLPRLRRGQTIDLTDDWLQKPDVGMLAGRSRFKFHQFTHPCKESRWNLPRIIKPKWPGQFHLPSKNSHTSAETNNETYNYNQGQTLIDKLFFFVLVIFFWFFWFLEKAKINS